jgi:hypothetical protein
MALLYVVVVKEAVLHPCGYWGEASYRRASAKRSRSCWSNAPSVVVRLVGPRPAASLQYSGGSARRRVRNGHVAYAIKTPHPQRLKPRSGSASSQRLRPITRATGPLPRKRTTVTTSAATARVIPASGSPSSKPTMGDVTHTATATMEATHIAAATARAAATRTGGCRSRSTHTPLAAPQCASSQRVTARLSPGLRVVKAGATVRNGRRPGRRLARQSSGQPASAGSVVSMRPVLRLRRQPLSPTMMTSSGPQPRSEGPLPRLAG